MNQESLAFSDGSVNIARLFHTLTYLLGLQPWRTIAYAVGILCLFAMSWNIITVLLRLA
ncbi:MAPEG family protein [Microcystis aeruginosa]|uniref:MAPEG family protein n=1 Tax=Microcystis aeruginosa TaxID=1126 RepID=UPI0018EF06B9